MDFSLREVENLRVRHNSTIGLQLMNHVYRKFTNSRKAGSDDLNLIAGSSASNHAGKPPKSHSTTKRKWEKVKMSRRHSKK